MEALIFSQAAVFRLQQLASQVHQKTGTRYKLSTSQGVVNLLTDSGTIQANDVESREIKNSYQAFVEELDSGQIAALANQGIPIRHNHSPS